MGSNDGRETARQVDEEKCLATETISGQSHSE